MKRSPVSIVVRTLALTAVAGLVACGGSDSAEDELAETQAALLEAREAVAEARLSVRGAEEEIEEQTRTLEEAQKALAAAESQLAQVEASVDLRATDQVLFRSIQRRLLDEDHSVGVDVSRGVVTLRGSVPDAATAEQVIAIVRKFPGVTGVTSQLEINP